MKYIIKKSIIKNKIKKIFLVAATSLSLGLSIVACSQDVSAPQNKQPPAPSKNYDVDEIRYGVEPTLSSSSTIDEEETSNQSTNNQKTSGDSLDISETNLL